jgi:hypothetical protein
VPPLKVTGSDHEGGGWVQMFQVRGGKFVKETDWFRVPIPRWLPTPSRSRNNRVISGEWRRRATRPAHGDFTGTNPRRCFRTPTVLTATVGLLRRTRPGERVNCGVRPAFFVASPQHLIHVSAQTQRPINSA